MHLFFLLASSTILRCQCIISVTVYIIGFDCLENMEKIGNLVLA